jgi:hypothetical protein
MSKTTPKRRATRGRLATPYIGGHRFKSIGETEAGTDQQHFDLLADELPSLRMAVVLLNYSDEELEAKVQNMNKGELRALTAMADGLHAIGARHKAITELCDGVYARVLIVGDRVVRGPKRAEAAHA